MLEPVVAIVVPLLVLAIVAMLGMALFKHWLGSLGAPERRRSSDGGKHFDPQGSYVRREALFTSAERAFLSVLREAAGEDLLVLGKVRLLDVIQPAPGLAAGERKGAMNRIDRKHLDFVVCDPATTKIVCVIELDDASHRRSDRRARDELVDGALESAGVPIRHVPVSSRYSIESVRHALGVTPPAVAESDEGRGATPATTSVRIGRP